MERYICVHGHFYQPPRENPWLEDVEPQDSAYPYHDWNQRITAECYAPNASSRILDGKGLVTSIVNNYAKISFNFGATLLAWLEHEAPETYQAIQEADRQSRERFSGHGSALAQGYNHVIMPLASPRDKRTQVYWGVRDFLHRFGRMPEGMWLPETAVDVDTLEALAEQKIKFTILEPHQAKRVRAIGQPRWQEVAAMGIDPTRPYLVRLPSGQSIAVFFYDGPISRAIAFEGLLSNGERFADRLTSAFADFRSWPQIVNIATDGETYGHHHRHGDMALAYALHHIETRGSAKLTNYGEYLSKFPPTMEVEINEDTSWSCAHGIERWRSDCGCNSGGKPGWNQAWRRPLREAFDWLRDTLAKPYEAALGELFLDPWAARDAYIDVLVDRRQVEGYIHTQQKRPLTTSEQTRALKLLEMQRHAMLMYTSCGWFFDDVSGIETVQDIQYAGRALQLATEVFGASLEEAFIERLGQAKSNSRDVPDAGAIYERVVKPSFVDLPKVGAHYAVSSLFEPYAKTAKIHCYDVEQLDYRNFAAGKAKFAAGRACVTSAVTRDAMELTFGVLHFGDHNLIAGVRPFENAAHYEAFVGEAAAAFLRADLPAVIRTLDRHFAQSSTFSLKSLFRDEQRKVLDLVLAATLGEVESAFTQLYEDHCALMRFLSDLGNPLPRAFRSVSEFVQNAELARELRKADFDPVRLTRLLEEAKASGTPFDKEGLGLVYEKTLLDLLAQFASRPEDLNLLHRLETAASLLPGLPFSVDVAKAQNDFYALKDKVYEAYKQRPDLGNWSEKFRSLGKSLAMRVD